MDFDPAKIPYDRILELFWSSHDPTARTWSCQYKPILFWHDEAQRKAALASKERLEAKLGQTVRTEIRPFTAFWPAEDYHQKYGLRSDGALLKELTAFYPDAKDLMNSTAASRINAYVSGDGEPVQLEAEIDSLGLSEEGKTRLRAYVRGRR